VQEVHQQLQSHLASTTTLKPETWEKEITYWQLSLAETQEKFGLA